MLINLKNIIKNKIYVKILTLIQNKKEKEFLCKIYLQLCRTSICL